MDDKKPIRFVIMTVSSTLGSMAVGLALFQSGIISTDSSSFQFIADALIGGITFSSFRLLKKSNAILVPPILFAFQEVVAHPGSWEFILRDAVYIAGISVSFFVFASWFDRLLHARPLRFLLAGALMGSSYLMITILLDSLFVLNGGGAGINLVQTVYFNLAQGFLIGAGLGAGIELSEYLITKFLIGSTVR